MGDLTAACPLLCRTEKMVPGSLLRWAAGGGDDKLKGGTGKTPPLCQYMNHQHRLPREAVQSLSLEAFKTWQAKVLILTSWLILS